eukprot:850047-Rhodomonas_salina.1
MHTSVEKDERSRERVVEVDGWRVRVVPVGRYHHSWDKEAELPAEHARRTSFLGPFATRWSLLLLLR